jgi:hypothetical protein
MQPPVSAAALLLHVQRRGFGDGLGGGGVGSLWSRWAPTTAARGASRGDRCERRPLHARACCNRCETATRAAAAAPPPAARRNPPPAHWEFRLRHCRALRRRRRQRRWLPLRPSAAGPYEWRRGLTSCGGTGIIGGGAARAQDALLRYSRPAFRESRRWPDGAGLGCVPVSVSLALCVRPCLSVSVSGSEPEPMSCPF